MQKVLGAQGPHGELTELSVTGAQELAAAAEAVAVETAESERTATSSTMILHGAIAIGAGATAASLLDTAG